jgi:hypothetical protein
MRRRALAVLFIGTILAPAHAQSTHGDTAGFNHRQHAKLFPTCEGCHGGIATGNAATSLPTESQCRECHNGTDAKVVAWRPRARLVGLLRYSHPAHATKVDSAGRACATCHSGTTTAWMDVARTSAAKCGQCHAHATEHLSPDNRCATCHVPLPAARDLSREYLTTLPKPPTHERADFAANHAPGTALATASCAVCHARETCARCHVNASSVSSISSLGRDARVAALVANKPATYATPPDHERTGFEWNHGRAARMNLARCATCHARPSCETCHRELVNATVREMPQPEPGGAPGVQLRMAPSRVHEPAAEPHAALLLEQTVVARQAPARLVRVHALTYRTTHGGQAASGALTCTGCHEQRFCSDCHSGESNKRFHAANFVARHASPSYRREADCASCHNTEVFCKQCHEQSGLASRGRLDVAFHTAQPQWLLQHGRGARQGLASCTSCHTQRDCLACHSTVGWSVNPHGPDFDAARLSKRVAPSCLRCHVQVPGRQ